LTIITPYSITTHVTDYVGFIKKVMKQLQNPRYMLIQRADVDLRQLDDSELLTAAPGDN